jgi:hypothetical protein
MPLRVAFDLDGTIADMHAVLRLESERLFGAAAPGDIEANEIEAAESEEPAAPPTRAALSRQQHSALWDHVKTIDNFWNTLPEIAPGIVRRIAQTAEARRWEVIFLTTRPLVAGETVQRQSQRWLQAHGFALPSVFVVQRSRGRIAEALELDAVVDDRAENCLDVALDSKARAILVWPEYPRKAPLGVDRLSVRVVASIAEALDVLVQLDEQKQQPRVTRALRKLFGKESA